MLWLNRFKAIKEIKGDDKNKAVPAEPKGFSDPALTRALAAIEACIQTATAKQGATKEDATITVRVAIIGTANLQLQKLLAKQFFFTHFASAT